MSRVLRTILFVGALMPLVACTTVVAAPPQSTPSTGGDAHDARLRPGEQVALGDAGRLRYERLVNDSRCAPDVQCVWAGDAEVAFEWTSASGTRKSFSLHTGIEPRQQALDGHRLVLVALDRGPAPAATVRLEPAAP